MSLSVPVIAKNEVISSLSVLEEIRYKTASYLAVTETGDPVIAKNEVISSPSVPVCFYYSRADGNPVFLSSGGTKDLLFCLEDMSR